MANRRRRLTTFLPIWLEALFPKQIRSLFKKELETGDKRTVARENSYIKEEKEEKYLATEGRAEVLLHLFDGFSAFGHMDFAFDDKVISYGCYDISTHRMFGCISDGVLAIADRKPYIDYCLQQEKKFLIGYQLLLSPEQENRIRQKLDHYSNDLLPWYSDYVRAEKGLIKAPVDGFSDPASLLQRTLPTRFFKFRRGKFKTYFSLNTNCAMLIDDIMGEIGEACITPPGGIITPGAGYRYFETLLSRKDSIVVGREVYL